MNFKNIIITFLVIFVVTCLTCLAHHEIGSYGDDPLANLYEFTLACLNEKESSITDGESFFSYIEDCRNQANKRNDNIVSASKSASDSCGSQYGINSVQAVDCWYATDEAKQWQALYQAPCSGESCSCVEVNQYNKHTCQEMSGSYEYYLIESAISDFRSKEQYQKCPYLDEYECEEDLDYSDIELSIDDWKQFIVEDYGMDSEAYKTLSECDSAMQEQIEKCSRYEGWMVDNVIEISDLEYGYSYDYPKIKKGGCSKKGSKTTKIDTKNFDSVTGSYQILCSINCYSWECEKAAEKNTELVQAKETKESIKSEKKYKKGDTIKTEEIGTTVKLLRTSSIDVYPNTVLEVEEIGEEKNSFFLRAGKLLIYVEKLLNKRFTVRTPISVAAVRGTEFMIEYDEQAKETILHLNDGYVELTTSKGEAKEVSAGQTVKIDEQGEYETSSLSDTGWKKLTGTEEKEQGNKTLLIAVFLIFIIAAAVVFIIFKKKK